MDFTILAATSVLSDLIEKCPPAEACRDAFVRMSKATVTMCMNSTGFGSQSNLGTQPVATAGGYFGQRNSIQRTLSQDQTPDAPRYRKPIPRFDMNLKDLFSEEEIDNRPVTRPPNAPAFLRSQNPAAPPISLDFKTPPVPTVQQSESFAFSSASPQSSTGGSQHQSAPQSAPDVSPSFSYQISNQQPYQPFAETISQAQPDFTFDNLDFLDTFPVADPSQNLWGNSNELDLGFGTGGLAGFDSSGAWEANSGVDLFDGFFFGNSGSTY